MLCFLWLSLYIWCTGRLVALIIKKEEKENFISLYILNIHLLNDNVLLGTCFFFLKLRWKLKLWHSPIINGCLFMCLDKRKTKATFTLVWKLEPFCVCFTNICNTSFTNIIFAGVTFRGTGFYEIKHLVDMWNSMYPDVFLMLTCHPKKPLHLSRIRLATIKSWTTQVFQIQMYVFIPYCRVDPNYIYLLSIWVVASQIFRSLVGCFMDDAINTELFAGEGHKHISVQLYLCNLDTKEVHILAK